MTHTILFYSEDGPAAKAKAAAMRDKDNIVRPIHSFVVSERQFCEAIAFMPDVDQLERDRLAALFEVPVSDIPADIERPASKVAYVGPASSAGDLIVGKGPRGKFYVKRGKEIITGPFDSEDDAIAAKAREASL